MADSIFVQIERLLSAKHVEFTVLRHAPVHTSAEAATVRGTTLASGAKALVCKVDDTFVLFVMPADRKLDSKRLRQERGWKNVRFATPAEVAERTGLEPGSIPPFGSLFNLPTYCDTRLAEQANINFNAGDHAVSIAMRYDDYVAVEQPQLGIFAT